MLDKPLGGDTRHGIVGMVDAPISIIAERTGHRRGYRSGDSLLLRNGQAAHGSAEGGGAADDNQQMVAPSEPMVFAPR
jgi:hypothetical protein